LQIVYFLKEERSKDKRPEQQKGPALFTPRFSGIAG
jgi:hypothetical protein